MAMDPDPDPRPRPNCGIGLCGRCRGCVEAYEAEEGEEENVKMTREQYLIDAGWIHSTKRERNPEDTAQYIRVPDLNSWRRVEHPVFSGEDACESWVTMEQALAVQRAADAAEERDLYRRAYAAAIGGHAYANASDADNLGPIDGDEYAWQAVESYRARFAVELAD